MVIYNILFTLLTFSVFGFFSFRIRKTWQLMNTVGQGAEENRLDDISTRINNVFLGGLLQIKMFKDILPGIMHSLIFWGFITVSLGTLETLLYGMFSFSLAHSLGNGLLQSFFLITQDWANF